MTDTQTAIFIKSEEEPPIAIEFHTVNTKETLLQEIDALTYLIRTRYTDNLMIDSPFDLFTVLKQLWNKSFDSSNPLSECVDLKAKAIATDDQSPEFFELSKKYFLLEMKIKKNITQQNNTSTILGIYIGLLTVFMFIIDKRFMSFIEKQFAVKSSLVIFAILGSVVYLATSVLSRINNNSTGNSILKLLNFPTRLLLAIIISIVLASFFLDTQGIKQDIQLTPELLSFVCGYSVKLVMEILNKILQKAQKMIEAI